MVTHWLDGCRLRLYRHLGHLIMLRMHYQQPKETIFILLVPATGELVYNIYKSYNLQLKAVTVVDGRVWFLLS
jgi:hypothetical protein